MSSQDATLTSQFLDIIQYVKQALIRNCDLVVFKEKIAPELVHRIAEMGYDVNILECVNAIKDETEFTTIISVKEKKKQGNVSVKVEYIVSKE